MWSIKKTRVFQIHCVWIFQNMFSSRRPYRTDRSKKTAFNEKTHIVRMILVSIFPWYNGPLWSSQLFIAYEKCFRNMAWIKIQNIHFLGLRRALLLSLSLAIALFCLSFHYLLIFRVVSICSVISVYVAAAISPQKTVFVTPCYILCISLGIEWIVEMRIDRLTTAEPYKLILGLVPIWTLCVCV